ncbi:hypothetical protein [Streptomyces iakyrus]|uniref:hypothetical protein n=1 Tax=Streptomyces iakyrus TaxID=68219 RepID=UPI0033E5E86D
MALGDRIWVYFTTPVKEVAAVAEVVGEPYEALGDAEYLWRFQAVPNLGATRALYRSPVPLSALANQHPQSPSFPAVHCSIGHVWGTGLGATGVVVQRRVRNR